MITNHYIDNKESIPVNYNQTAKVIDSTTGCEIIKVPLDDLESVDNAINSSEKAFVKWSSMAIHKRIALLTKWWVWINDNKERLSLIISKENGKTKNDAMSELERGLEVVQFSLSAPTLLKGDNSVVNSSIMITTTRYPVGITVGIAPFNFPIMIPLWMIPISLVCGNVFILKASEIVPTVALELAKGACEIGIPPGVFNVINGGSLVVNKLISSQKTKTISFVGSTRVGKIIKVKCDEYGKRYQLNMGAKNHAIVMQDCDVDRTMDAIISAAFGGAGQRCMALSVMIYVGNDMDSLLALLCKKVKNLSITDDVGALVSKASLDRLHNILDENHSSIVLDGRDVKLDDMHSNGFYLGPTIVTVDSNNLDTPLYCEELFGPILCCMQVDTLDKAINIINNNPYGNGVALFTESLTNIKHFTSTTQIGQTGINMPIPVPPPYYSWTSTKDSYAGHAHIYGPETFNFYTQKRTVMSQIKGNFSMVMPT